MSSTAKIIHTDQRYITGLLQNDAAVVREIYQRFSNKVKSYLLQNNGTEDDAADIFQESLIDIYQQARFRDLQLTCPFEPFFLLVCKRKWLNELKKRGRQRVTNEPGDVSLMGEDAFALAENMRLQEEKQDVFLLVFRQLGDKCREIIQKCLEQKPQEEVATELGVSYAYLRKKKSECMAELVRRIREKQVPGYE